MRLVSAAKFFTVALAQGRGLEIASTGKGQCLGLVDIDSHPCTTPVDDHAEALRLSLDNSSELLAA